ncbi:hypothetical protein AA101099_1738 [Neoasaia chiangmaiensis NBRC 101099]|nr:hypothetical protein AA101099_1738 [Neoasaia chiangmaiensis NBRC 101099]
MAEKSGVNSAMGVAPATADFVKEVAVSDMFEIQSSKLALAQHDRAAHSFATQMVADHQKTSSQLKSLVHSANINADVPTALDSSHQDMLDKLHKLHGKEFAAQYRQDQIDGHNDAVSLFKRYADSGDNAALKSWAGQTLPKLQQHLAEAQKLPQ